MREATVTAIYNVCQDLIKVAEMIRADEKTVLPTRDHIDIIKHFNHVRLAAASIRESREAIAEMEQKLSYEEVPEVMREHNIRNITVEGVGRVALTQRYSCSMLDKQMGMEWLRENGHGGLIIETVNSSTLSAFAKTLLAEEGEELPRDLFKTSMATYTSITKAGVIKNGE